MKKAFRHFLFRLLIVLLGLSSAPAFAQQEELILTFSRDFGYSSGTGDIQGTFSMKVSGPDSLVRVAFLIDGEAIGEDTEPPFKIQFNTGSFPIGQHTLSAIGYTADGTQLHAKEYQRNFVTAEEGWKSAMKIAGPILLLAFGISVLSFVFPFLLGRGKAKTVPMGAPRVYGLSGGAICPKCSRPFSIQLLGLNLLVGKLNRCPYCGKWSLVNRASPAALKAAEAAELGMGTESTEVVGETEEEKLRKDLEASRFQDT